MSELLDTTSVNSIARKTVATRGRPSVYPRVLAQMSEMLESSDVQPGTMLMSEHDLSEQFQVSRPIVRRALGQLAKQGKIISKAGVGHFVAGGGGAVDAVDSSVGRESVGQASRLSPSRPSDDNRQTGAIIAALGSTISHLPAHYSYSMQVMQGLEEVISNSNYRLLWEMIGSDKRSVGKMVKPHISELYGLAAIPLSDQPVQEYLASASEDTSKVVIGRPAKEFNTPCVYVNHKKGLMRGMDYLLSLGHRKIGYIGGAEKSYPAIQRWDGFKEALSNYGLSSDDMPAAHVFHGSVIGGNIEQVESAVNNLLDQIDNMSALIVSSGTYLSFLLSAIQARGISIPQDLSVISFDDTHESQQNLPGITTIRQPAKQMGEIGGEILLQQLIPGRRDITTKAQEITLDCELIVRDSCANIKINGGAGVPPVNERAAHEVAQPRSKRTSQSRQYASAAPKPVDNNGGTGQQRNTTGNINAQADKKVDALADSFIHPTDSAPLNQSYRKEVCYEHSLQSNLNPNREENI